MKMKSHDPDEPAYPVSIEGSYEGFTKRERFVAGAHHALLSNPSLTVALGMAPEELTLQQSARAYAEAAVVYANALIEALNEEAE